MAVNFGYPANYFGAYQPMQMPQPQQKSDMIWVQGEAGAKSYLVAPNTTVQLWDSEAPVIYLKSADASGMPSMKIIDYTIRNSTPQKPSILPENEFATKTDINTLRGELEALKGQIEGLTAQPKRPAKKEAVKDEQ